MIGGLPRPLQRLLAVVLLLAVVGGAAWAVAGPVLGIDREYRQRIAELQHQLERFRGMAAQEERLRAHLQRLQAPGAAGGYYLGGATAALAAAELQRLVKRVVTTHRGTIVSTQAVPTAAEGGIERVVVRVQMRGDIDTVQRTFHALETGQPYLFLDNLQLRVWMLNRRGAETTGPQELNVSFDLTGYLMNRGGDAA